MRRLVTSRLELVPATIELLDAELESVAALASLLGARVPEGWPPGEYDRPAIEYFRDRLAESPDAAGSYSWYALTRPEAGMPQTAVGAGGFHGPPDADGVVEIGYSVLPVFEGRGYATEIVRALVQEAFASGRVKRIIARTTTANAGSIQVLERAGFRSVGPGQDPGTVEYAQVAPGT